YAKFFSRCRIAAGSRVVEPAAQVAPRQSAMESAMKYMLLIYSNESQWQGLAKSEIDQRMAAYLAYTEAMTKAGVIVGGDRLRSADATTTVRVANGKTNVLNGPYAETREQLGGHYLIDVPISTR